MSRRPEIKELIGTRLLKTSGGWIYCDSCGENIGYLCYVTYDSIIFTYTCQCGNHGSIHIAFHQCKEHKESACPLIPKKNRLCCPADQSPILTILEKKLSSYHYLIECSECGTYYSGQK